VLKALSGAGMAPAHGVPIDADGQTGPVIPLDPDDGIDPDTGHQGMEMAGIGTVGTAPITGAGTTGIDGIGTLATGPIDTGATGPTGTGATGGVTAGSAGVMGGAVSAPARAADTETGRCGPAARAE